MRIEQARCIVADCEHSAAYICDGCGHACCLNHREVVVSLFTLEDELDLCPTCYANRTYELATARASK